MCLRMQPSWLSSEAAPPPVDHRVELHHRPHGRRRRTQLHQRLGAFKDLADAHTEIVVQDDHFTPGDVASLSIKAELGDMGGGEDAPPADDPQAKAQMKMMAPMMAGMRSTIIVKVNGEVTETTAEIPIGKSKNTFALFDLKIGKILADDKMIAEMNKFSKGPPKKTINFPAIKIQNPSEPTVIKFK